MTSDITDGRAPVTHDGLVALLMRELLPALGCTEPIAIALTAARARALLGCPPERLTVRISENVYKNARAVVIPNSGGRHGIPLAAALGAVAGNDQAGLEVLAGLDDDDVTAAVALAESGAIDVDLADVGGLYVDVIAAAGRDVAEAAITGDHTNFTTLTRNGESLLTETPRTTSAAPDPGSAIPTTFSAQEVLDFARDVDLASYPDLVALLERQIADNTRIAEEGLARPYGAQVGRTLIAGRQIDTRLAAKARAAAGADARMGGSPLPVVINAGSGNQGITVTMPVVTYAEDLGASHETLIRALLIANLLGLLQKEGIGRLSAFCGASSAASGAGAAIAWLKGLDDAAVIEALTTSLATTGGMVCDGATASCPAKVSVALEGALSAVEIVEAGHHFDTGTGILGATPEATIANVGRLARDGMRTTDAVMVDIMREADRSGSC